ncbi:uridine kinase family-domain-containing protein [Schizophyllum commune]
MSGDLDFLAANVLTDQKRNGKPFLSEPASGPQEPPIQPKKNTVLVSHGRPPWYGEDGEPLFDAFVIAVAGLCYTRRMQFTRLIDTHVSRQIVKALGSIPSVIILSQDSFYKQHGPEEIALAYQNRFDFDHPDSIDMELFAKCLSDLKAGRQTNIPIYSFQTHQRQKETQYLYGAAIIITEGILALHDARLRKLYDLKVYVQCDSDLMLARRIRRDVAERGRDVSGILDQYLRFVKPSFDHFVQPSASHADIIVPGVNNDVAIDLLTTHIRRKLKERSNHFRHKMAIPRMYLHEDVEASLDALNLTVLPMTPQRKGVFTMLRDKNCSKQDFIFYTDRLATTLAEHSMQHLPFIPHEVITPVGVLSKGKRVADQQICGVSILRGGGVLERGFRRVYHDVPIGSLLVQSECLTGEPLLLHTKLPVCVRNRETAKNTYCFILDAQIGTGAAALMAIRVLLDHGVPQDHIIFVTLLVARGGGISVLRRAFPHVKIVCGAVDDEMKERWLEGIKGDENPEGVGRVGWVMSPGMGQIGDRYWL